uniref:Uncharacterized protein n=1 Tax=Arundo donax TaxID=35708 RepID=A0A0A8Y493_ARUDO
MNYVLALAAMTSASKKPNHTTWLNSTELSFQPFTYMTYLLV